MKICVDTMKPHRKSELGLFKSNRISVTTGLKNSKIAQMDSEKNLLSEIQKIIPMSTVEPKTSAKNHSIKNSFHFMPTACQNEIGRDSRCGY